MPNSGRNHSLTEKNKTLKHLKHIVKQYDKPEHILNIHRVPKKTKSLPKLLAVTLSNLNRF